MAQYYEGSLFGQRHYVEIKEKARETMTPSKPVKADVDLLSDTLKQTYGKEFLTVSDIEKYTGFSVYTIRKLVRESIPSKLVGRNYIIHISAFAAWILEREVR